MSDEMILFQILAHDDHGSCGSGYVLRDAERAERIVDRFERRFVVERDPEQSCWAEVIETDAKEVTELGLRVLP